MIAARYKGECPAVRPVEETKMRTAVLSAVPGLFGVLLSLASALPSQNIWTEKVCIDRIKLDLPRLETRVPIVPGCEVIDCCPGCPGVGELDWTIDVTGPDLGAVELRLDGFTAAETIALTTGEGIRREHPDRLLVATGTRGARISGVPMRGRGRPPVVWPVLVLDPERTQKLLAMHAPGDQPEFGVIEVDVRQHFRSFLVNSYHLTFRLVPCGQCEAADVVRLTGNTSGDCAVVLLDGQRSGCSDDEIWRGVGDIGVGLVKASSACNGEVAVFSDDNAMALQPVAWTDGPDLVEVVLQPLIEVPIHIWLMTPTIAGSAPALDTAKSQVALANMLFNENHAGIVLVPTYVDLSADAAAVALVGTDDDALDNSVWVNALVGSPHFVAGMINVYYVPQTPTVAAGRNSALNRNIAMVANVHMPHTLAHEIGHALSLQHMEGYGNYDNVMYPGSDSPTLLFTEGQGFRININPTSVLNTNQHRVGLTRSCPHNAADPLCPSVEFDATPN